jgi:phosphoribosylaminoimidazole-succinocarboxamide synthase
MVSKKEGERMKILAEGKTKIVYDAGDGEVILESKDAITAGDGVRKDVITGKSRLATRTTVNVFRLLNQHNIPTHFVKQIDETKLLCLRCDMIPLEVTIRGTATGSYVKRHPGVSEGSPITPPVVEFFLKDDARHDPLVAVSTNGTWYLYDPKRPVTTDSQIGSIDPPLLSEQEISTIEERALQIFSILRQAWEKQGVLLVDLKIEFGRTVAGDLVVADVIDNDSWRLWPEGNKEQQLDKQIYREGGDLEDVLRNYQDVSDLTERFV